MYGGDLLLESPENGLFCFDNNNHSLYNGFIIKGVFCAVQMVRNTRWPIIKEK